MKFGSDALFAVLFVFVGGFAILRYIAGDLTTAAIAGAAWIAVGVLLVRAIFKNG
jgi:hypothetical protein